MKTAMKTISIILAAALGIMTWSAVKAGPLEDMQNVLVYLKKARMTSAVQAKNENLKKAKELLTVTTYEGTEDRAAALMLTMQAIGKVNDFKLDKANQNIDMAIVKVKHAIQAIKQKTAAQKKKAPQKK